MRDDFAVFILSHGRAESQTTLKQLEIGNYSGKWYIIVDDLDDQKDQYIEKYGDHVIVFDKREQAKVTDTMSSKEELRSVVYARNKAYDIAEELGLKYFAQLDDDLNRLMYRFVEDGKLKSSQIRSMDMIFEAMIDFLEVSGAYSVGMCSANGLIGGAKNEKFQKRVLIELYQCFICKTNRRIKFVGILNEDDNACNLMSKVGKMTYAISDIMMTAPLRSTNSGGLNELYIDNDAYIRAFHSIIPTPAGLKIKAKGQNVTLVRSAKNLFPKIISESWKK